MRKWHQNLKALCAVLERGVEGDCEAEASTAGLAGFNGGAASERFTRHVLLQQ